MGDTLVTGTVPKIEVIGTSVRDQSLLNLTGTGGIVVTADLVGGINIDGAGASAASLPLIGGTLTGNLLFSADNLHDIGALGATRPRTVYIGTSILTPYSLVTGGASNFSISYTSGATAYDICGNGVALRIGPFPFGTPSNPGEPNFEIFPNANPSFGGQIYFDSGNVAGAAIVFREGQGGTVKNRLTIALNGNVTFTKGISGNGNILFTDDNVSNIGAVGATRPANIYAGASINAGTLIVAGTTITAGTAIVAGTTFTAGDALKITGHATLPVATTDSLYMAATYPSDSSQQVTLATDNFNRADGGLGANWTNNVGTFKIVSNAAASNASTGVFEFNHYNAVTFPPDQWAQITVGAVTAVVYIGICVRAAAAATTCYAALGYGTSLTVRKIVAGVQTIFNGGASVGTFVSGDVLLLAIQGTTLTLYKNGVSIFSVVDSAIASGQPGLSGFGTAGTSTMDDWTAGAFTYPLGRIYVGDGTGLNTFEFAKRTGSVDTPLFIFSDSGVLTMTGNLIFSVDNANDIGAVGATRPRTIYVGTSVVAPLFNAATGFQIGGGAASGNVLRGNGTNFVSATLAAADLSNGVLGAGAVVLASALSGGVLATVDLTAQSTAIGATTLYAVPVSGDAVYRISWSADITTISAGTSVLGGTSGFQIVATSPTDSVAKTFPRTSTSGVNTDATNTTATGISGSIVVFAKASTNIQYQMDYTSVGGTMIYELHIRCERL